MKYERGMLLIENRISDLLSLGTIFPKWAVNYEYLLQRIAKLDFIEGNYELKKHKSASISKMHWNSFLKNASEHKSKIILAVGG